MSPRKPAPAPPEPGRTGLAVPRETLRRLGDALRAEAELGSLTARLDQIADYKRDPGARGNAYVEGLVRRRAELLERPRAARPDDPRGPGRARAAGGPRRRSVAIGPGVFTLGSPRKAG